MSPKKNRTQNFIKTLPRNIFSGFVVSLIALPLGLGLAMASEAPPIAGIITAVIGGVLVSILGGSHITITGPGNGLVGVLLIAITALGLESTYAAIICSGIILMTLGFLRMGKLADFFPSSAIQGMLAAIGLIILGKQFHIMLGNKINRDSSVDYLLEIPNTIINVFSYKDKGLLFAAAFGILSLCIMMFYDKLRNKYFQLVPAPMWIVIISIGFSYYYELFLNQPNPISPAYMLTGIPALFEIVSEIPTPDFTKIGSFTFWMSVVSLTLIASIESLLSIKAVDKLDPLKRRSNINRDLKALGLATIGSGFLGGLNVVTVIARSSVNVNNGGSNRSANFAHALFLVIFIGLFSTQLTRIPLPALMAILVYTGYKLASPQVVRNMFTIGKEQVIIFFTTLLTTLFVDLISGILAGILITLVIHIILNKSAGLFFRNIFKPNVLVYQEKEGNYYVSIKHFCSFINFFKLKQQLEAIPENQDVIVDFSKCHFVDHTVMENLHNFQEAFSKKGGHFEIVGLDMHGADTEHPFALRKIIPVPTVFTKSQTKRQLLLEEVASNYDLEYHPDKNNDVEDLYRFLYFETKHIQHSYNEFKDLKNKLHLFDIIYSEGEFIAKETIRSTMITIDLPISIPTFTIDKEGFLEKFYAIAGWKDINIVGHSDFSNRFYLIGENDDEIRDFFSVDLIHFLESNPYYHIESRGNQILIFSKERLATIKEIKALLDYSKRLEKVLLRTPVLV
ncbi:SulP family inorganic anion transporter [Dokdonia sp. Hel_I_53]|uniref:SulP family inorganic anion transporter n=1 Tax=Dokdonia sp. Hel_I_53 TaxID=1566287 RepID=UPI00119A74D2|nr:SulP family inorganic anion transporter [Dokdonia sp. Hel_I_53]TVZ51074.1 MFS superfamily sulfate permease-like transporter [Dokdonia sp. Hel_I_53]